ncbi:hypothetical protein GCM10009735_66480 [Actinomadura chokoriensis]
MRGDRGAAVRERVRGEPVPDPRARVPHRVRQDRGQLGAVHPERRRQIGAARPGVGDLGDQRAVRRPQPEHVDPEPGCLDPVPDPEVAQDAQRVALQRDPGPERDRPRRRLRDVDLDPAPRQQDGERRPGRAAAHDENPAYRWHADLTSPRWG